MDQFGIRRTILSDQRYCDYDKKAEISDLDSRKNAQSDSFTSEPPWTQRCMSQWRAFEKSRSIIGRSDFQMSKNISVLPLSILLENVAANYAAEYAGIEVITAPCQSLEWMDQVVLDIEKFVNALVQYQPHSIIVMPQMLIDGLPISTKSNRCFCFEIHCGWKEWFVPKVCSNKQRIGITCFRRLAESGMRFGHQFEYRWFWNRPCWQNITLHIIVRIAEERNTRSILFRLMGEEKIMMNGFQPVILTFWWTPQLTHYWQKEKCHH